MKNRLIISFFIGFGVLLFIPDFFAEEKVEKKLVEDYVSSNEYQCILAPEDVVVSMVGKTVIADTESNINVRTGPGTENSVVGLMIEGNGGEILEEAGDWYYISSGEVAGYVCKDYFHKASKKELKEFSVAITIEEYNRQAIATAEAAQRAIVTAVQTNTTLAIPEVYIDSTSNATLRDSLVSYAMGFQNIPYVYGGSTIAGLDCSGFTMLVYGQFGHDLPHNSGLQAGYGNFVSPTTEALLPGDILYRPGHVALYIGNGQIIHASYSSRKIIVTSMNCISWSGARRIIN